MKVYIDTREQNRIKTATKYFTEQGLEVEVKELEIGDYLFTDDHNSVCFEYKEVNDFITSINDGRVFNQAINMAEEYDYRFVVIRGTESERAKYLAISKNYRSVSIFQYHGAIASLNRYTTVIESYTPYINEAYYRMYIQAKKCLQDKPVVKKFPRKHKNVALNFLMYTVYGISAKKAMAIVDTLNLHTLTDLQSLTLEKLQGVDGIGKKNAQTIMEAIK